MGQAGLCRERPLATHRCLPRPLLLALHPPLFRASLTNRLGREGQWGN